MNILIGFYKIMWMLLIFSGIDLFTIWRCSSFHFWKSRDYSSLRFCFCLYFIIRSHFLRYFRSDAKVETIENNNYKQQKKKEKKVMYLIFNLKNNKRIDIIIYLDSEE